MTRQCWVIFDTCTKPEYYRDLHTVLSAPADTIVRYSYRRKYLSKDADKLASDWRDPSPPWYMRRPATEYPQTVLLIYGQIQGFKHDADFDAAVDSGKPKIWIPTRFGDLVNVEQARDEFYFDIRLGTYPTVSDPTPVDSVIASLSTSNPLAPLKNDRRWVALTERVDEVSQLRGVTEDGSAWSEIVDRFHEETQFKDDSFWRFESAKYVRDGARIPTLPYRGSDHRGTVYLCYRVEHDREIAISLENREPPSGSTNRQLLVTADSDSVRISPQTVPLRPYFAWTLKVRARTTELLVPSHYAMQLASGDQTGKWPVGSGFSLTLEVHRSAPELVAGFLSGIFGASALYWATTFASADASTSERLCFTFLFAMGASLLSIASYLLYRQLKLDF